MDPSRFQDALQNPVPPGNLLDALVEDWHAWISEAINEIAPWCPLHSQKQIGPVVFPGAEEDEARTETAREEVLLC